MHAVRTAGVFLIHAGVTLRCLVRLGRMEHPGWVVALLALNAALLILEAWVASRQVLCPPERTTLPSGVQASAGWTRDARDRLILKEAGAQPRFQGNTPPSLAGRGAGGVGYLLLQAATITALLQNRQTQDFFALLFVPISLSAVLFYGKRGFWWIAAFALTLAVPLITSEIGWRLGAVLAVNYGGLCFLFGGYAYQVRQAEATRRETQRMYGELQIAHGQLRQYASQKEELAAEQARNRLARELHDSVTQTVFSMNLTVQAARLLLARDRSRVADQLSRLEELAANALREIQALVSSLRPAPPAAEDLPTALRRLAAERRDRDGLEVALEVSGEAALPEPVAAGLYLIAQEALANVVKHAGVNAATVRLRLAAGATSLEVEDQGRGFTPQAGGGEHGHLGLAGMAERARDIGWHLTIAAQPEQGTRVRVMEDARGGEP